MNRVKYAVNETLKHHPGLSAKEVSNLITWHIEEDLVRIAAKVRSPSAPSLSFKGRKKVARMKQRHRDKKISEIQEKIGLIEILNIIKRSSNGWTTGSANPIPPDGWTAGSSYTLGRPADTADYRIKSSFVDIPQSMDIPDVPEGGSLDREIVELFTGEGTNVRDFLSPELPEGPEDITVPDELSDLFTQAQILSGGKIESVDYAVDPTYGKLIQMEVDLDAREALRLWSGLLSTVKTEGILNVKWRGVMNVTDDELVNSIVEIMMKSGVGPRALPGFDVVEAIREGRD